MLYEISRRGIFSSIQVLRFAAALMVVVHHALVEVARASEQPFSSVLTSVGWLGSAGVLIFFVISGFVMRLTAEKSFGREGALGDFLTRRIIRIYPIYLLIAFLYLAFPISVALEGQEPLEILASLALLPGYAAGIIPPGWTLAYEMYFYICFALVIPFRPGVAAVGLTVFFLASIAAGALTGLRDLNATLWHATNPLLLLFIVGVWFAAMRETMARWLSGRRPVAVGLVLALLSLAAAPALRSAGLPNIITLGIPSVLLVGVAVTAEVGGWISGWIHRQAWLGDSSYALYLVHIFVVDHGARLLVDDASGLIFRLLAVLALVVMSVLAGILIHYTVERPVTKALRGVAARAEAGGFRAPQAARTRPASTRTAGRAVGP